MGTMTEVGQRQDLDALWSQLRLDLRAFIAKRISDPDAADDLVQDVFMKVQKAGIDLDRIASVPAWLYRIARNTLVDHYRTRRRHEPLSVEVERELEALEDEDSSGVNQATRELASCLRPLIDQLEPMYRDALLTTDLGGLTQTEAAARLGLSVSGMKSRVQRARRQLRRVLTDCCTIHTDPAGRIGSYHPIDHSCQC
jgi:RNA polymerase sigma-70 factor (ECF subfamily)